MHIFRVTQFASQLQLSQSQLRSVHYLKFGEFNIDDLSSICPPGQFLFYFPELSSSVSFLEFQTFFVGFQKKYCSTLAAAGRGVGSVRRERDAAGSALAFGSYFMSCDAYSTSSPSAIAVGGFIPSINDTRPSVGSSVGSAAEATDALPGGGA